MIPEWIAKFPMSMNIGMTAKENVATASHALVERADSARLRPRSNTIHVKPENRSESPTCIPKDSVIKKSEITIILITIGSICVPS